MKENLDSGYYKLEERRPSCPSNSKQPANAPLQYCTFLSLGLHRWEASRTVAEMAVRPWWTRALISPITSAHTPFSTTRRRCSAIVFAWTLTTTPSSRTSTTLMERYIYIYTDKHTHGFP